MSEDELVNFRLRHVGFVFQSYNLFPSYDALENVAMPLTYRGVPKQVRNRRARKMIQAVGLVHRMHHTPNKMSGGEQQRIGIARALVSNPQIIFADEPTGNLDVKTSARALKLMTDCVRERGTTLIVVTHDPEMSRYADRVIRLLDGRVLENSVNPNPDPIVPPEDSGQDWANEDKPAKPKPQKKQHHSLFGRHKHAETEASVQAEVEIQPKPEPPKEEPAVQVKAEIQPSPNRLKKKHLFRPRPELRLNNSLNPKRRRVRRRFRLIPKRKRTIKPSRPRMRRQSLKRRISPTQSTEKFDTRRVRGEDNHNGEKKVTCADVRSEHIAHDVHAAERAGR